jgi:hypothetical protein
MSNLEAAKVAKEWIKQQLKGKEWVRGVGIGKETDGTYCVVLNVSELNPEVASELPESPVNGVKIRVEAVGDIAAYDKS